MNVKFKPVPPEDKHAILTDILNQCTRSAVIFSRISRYNECIAIVPTDSTDEVDKRYWVWLNGEDGAYADGKARSVEGIIKTLITGEWDHQPNATITMDVKRA
jgi:hypothetical protein